MILAIKLPDGLTNPLLIATLQHPRLGKLLFFDPTNELTPFGQIGGYLQDNYGLLVTPDGGDLVEVPKQPPAMNGIQRTAKLSLVSRELEPSDNRRCAPRRRILTASSPSRACWPARFRLSRSLMPAW